MSNQKRTVRELKCAHCQTNFTATRFDAKFCSRSCAVLAKRETKRLEALSLKTRSEAEPYLVVCHGVEFNLSMMDKAQCLALYDSILIATQKTEAKKIKSRLEELEAIEKRDKFKDRILNPPTKK